MVFQLQSCVAGADPQAATDWARLLVDDGDDGAHVAPNELEAEQGGRASEVKFIVGDLQDHVEQPKSRADATVQASLKEHDARKSIRARERAVGHAPVNGYDVTMPDAPEAAKELAKVQGRSEVYKTGMRGGLVRGSLRCG